MMRYLVDVAFSIILYFFLSLFMSVSLSKPISLLLSLCKFLSLGLTSVPFINFNTYSFSTLFLCLFLCFAFLYVFYLLLKNLLLSFYSFSMCLSISSSTVVPFFILSSLGNLFLIVIFPQHLSFSFFLAASGQQYLFTGNSWVGVDGEKTGLSNLGCELFNLI